MEDLKSYYPYSNKLFIGGLSPQTTQESLHSHFSILGNVKDCVLMVDRNSGRSRCFGFVTMEDPSLIDQILSQDQLVDGRKADCKRAVPKEPSIPLYQTTFRTKKVFVGGLPNDITEDKFKEFFEQFGPVEDSIVMLDRDTGRPRGFGFITFVDEESTERLLANPDLNYINGKWIDCKKAVPKAGPSFILPYAQMYEHYDAQEFIPMAYMQYSAPQGY
jgi:RNA recognition motif-containing protein